MTSVAGRSQPVIWGVLCIGALLWPSRLSGWLDGVPLDHVVEAVVLGVAVPALWWLHPAFLRSLLGRLCIAGLLLLKLFAALTVAQDGWCVRFESPTPLARDGRTELHSWDLRADWRSLRPACSAVMTRSYDDTAQFPVWFFNLAPPTDAPHRGGYDPGQIPIRMRISGFLETGRPGRLELRTDPAMGATLFIDGFSIGRTNIDGHDVPLAPGVHSVLLEGTLLGKSWQVTPLWDGRPLASPLFPSITVEKPATIDRIVRPAANWIATGLTLLLLVSWLRSWVMHIQQQGLLPHLRTAFLLVGVPWLAYVVAANAHEVARWTLYGVGDDNFAFQRFSYRIFMQGYWLEGGQVTFWNQPLYRWIVGGLHMVFGDSSVGEVYWDAAGVVIMALFACDVVRRLTSFRSGLIAATIVFVVFLVGPESTFIGFGLSEISSAGFLYLAALFAMRARSRGRAHALAAGILAALAFLTRLNNFPMACAVAAFALPLDVPVRALLRPASWWPRISWSVVLAVASSLVVSLLLLATRTWHYTGVFSPFHGTQRDYLAIWQPGMPVTIALSRMVASLLMVVTVSDPPKLVWHAVPLLLAGGLSSAALVGVKGAVIFHLRWWFFICRGSRCTGRPQVGGPVASPFTVRRALRSACWRLPRRSARAEPSPSHSRRGNPAVPAERASHHGVTARARRRRSATLLHLLLCRRERGRVSSA